MRNDWKDYNWNEILALIFGVCLLLVLFVFLCGWIVMLLWNWIMPNVFDGIHEINIWQAYGMIILIRILFEPISKNSDKN